MLLTNKSFGGITPKSDPCPHNDCETRTVRPCDAKKFTTPERHVARVRGTVRIRIDNRSRRL